MSAWLVEIARLQAELAGRDQELEARRERLEQAERDADKTRVSLEQAIRNEQHLRRARDEANDYLKKAREQILELRRERAATSPSPHGWRHFVGERDEAIRRAVQAEAERNEAREALERFTSSPEVMEAAAAAARAWGEKMCPEDPDGILRLAFDGAGRQALMAARKQVVSP